MKIEIHDSVNILVEDSLYDYYKPYIPSLCSKINDLELKANNDRIQIYTKDVKETLAFSSLNSIDFQALLYKSYKNFQTGKTLRIFVIYHPETKCGLLCDVALKEKLLHDDGPRLLVFKKYLNNEKSYLLFESFRNHIEGLQALKEDYQLKEDLQ